MQKHYLIIAFVFVLFPLPSLAKDSFELRLQQTNGSDTDSGEAAYSQREDLFNTLTLDGLQGVLNNPINPLNVDGQMLLQGVEYQFQFNSGDDPSAIYVVLSSKCLDNKKTFEAGAPDQSLQQMVDWFQNGREGLRRDCLSEESPIDPVAGNPLSLMSNMLESDFAVASQNSPRNPQKRSAAYRLIPEMGRHATADYNYESYTLPASIVMPMAQPRNHLLLSMPVTQVNNNGSMSTSASFGVHLQRRISDYWQLTPGVRVGYVESDSFEAASAIYSASINNTFYLLFDRINISLHNLLSSYRTAKHPYSKYQTIYELENKAMKNAIRMDGSLNLHIFGAPGSWSLVMADTRFYGDTLYMEEYQDLSFSVGTRRRVGSGDWQAIRMGLTYTQGQHGFSGYRVNFGYFF